MKINKNTTIKKYTVLLFSLLILPSIFAITNIVPLKFIDEDEKIDEFVEEEGLFEEPIIDFDDTIPSFDPQQYFLDITEEEIVESTYDREAIDWRPIEDTLKNFQIKNEAESGTIATVSYNSLTGQETQSIPQFTPTPETATASGIRVVDPYKGLLPSETQATPESVIGGDDRKIYNNVGFPGRTIVKLYISAPWGGNWVGSGAIIDNFHVLTAGHCAYIYDDDTGNEGWASSIEVIPGMDQADLTPDPFGNAWVTGMRSYNGWTENENYEHDWALLTLDRNVGAFTGWMGRITAPSSSSIYDNTMNVAGYPTDLDSGDRLYHDSDSGDGAWSNNHFYWADTFGGMSGGPVWRYADGTRHIMTIHAYGQDGEDSNYGTRLNNNKFDRIKTWVSQDSAPIDKADLVDQGASYSSISFTAPLTAGVTTLTVINGIRNKGTAWSGDFYVHYYASKNDYISPSDYLLGSGAVSSIAPFDTDTASWSGKVPYSIPEGDYYIGWIIDQGNVVDEFDENNNRAWEHLEHIDGVPPPISYIEVRVRKNIIYRSGVPIRLSPIANAYVKVIKYGFWVADTGHTDAFGFYNVTGLTYGDYTVVVSKNGYYSETKVNTIHTSVVLSQGYDDDYLYFYLNEMPYDSGYIEVTVKDSTTSNLLASAKVELLNFTTDEVISSGYTNNIGEYTITGLWIGWYKVRVSRYGYSTKIKFDYINWNGDGDYLTFYMDEMPFDSGYVEVSVYNGTGAPVENAVVKTYDDSSGLLIDTGYTDVNGTYNVTGLTIGWYTINVSMLTFYGQEKHNYISWFGDDDYLTFFLTTLPPNSGFIDVYVYDNITSTPIIGVFIQTINQSSGDIIDSGYTDGSGYYTIENLTIGWYEVNITRVGYKSPESQLAQINYFGDGDVLQFSILPYPPDSGYIEVEILDDWSLLALQNATVECYYLNGTLFDTGYTDSSGFYNITGLYNGWYRVEVSKNNYVSQSTYDLINWNGDDDYLTFYLVISPPGYIEVSVFDQFGVYPVENAYITCYNAITDDEFDSGYADSSGFFNITEVLPGSWRVTVSHVIFVAQEIIVPINFLGEIAYLEFYLDTKYQPITGPVAIFRDNFPWNLNMTEPILDKFNISYKVYSSSNMSSVDLSVYQKVIIPSDQGQTFYNTLSNNTNWFENYVTNGGILQFHAADVPGDWHFGSWGNFPMPGGLNKTSVTTNNVTIKIPNHPVLLNPFRVDDDELDNWGYSSHGNFSEYPSSANEILLDVTNTGPVLIDFPFGSGFIIASMQTLEWNQNKEISKLLENLVLYSPEYYIPTINVTNPKSSSTWEVPLPNNITWDSTGSTDRIKIDLYKSGTFLMEITSNTPNDGEYSWMVTPGLDNSSLYKIRVYDADWPTVYDDSELLEIQDLRTITVVSPSSGKSWNYGNTYSINWTTTGFISDVIIDLYASGNLLMEISNGTTPNNGSFIWSIPAAIANFTDHIIRVSDAIDPAMYTDSPIFTIKEAPSGIPGYDLFILFTFMIGVSVIIIIRKRKNTNILKC